MRNAITTNGLRCVLGVCGLLLALATSPLSAQDAETRQRLEALEATQRAILQQLQEIKALVQAKPAQPAPAAAAPRANVDLAIEGAPTRGRADAAVTIVEFSDFECPFCGRFTRETRAQLERDYVDTGKVRMVFRHFPLANIHPHAMKAAQGAECARQQDKFWEMHAKLFANQQALTDTDLQAYARQAGLNDAAFQQCLAGGVPDRIRGDQAEGTRAGITGTPTFFLGRMTKDGKLHVLDRIVGAAPYATFKVRIDALLAGS
jgi:protein-disulfide isomerase